MIMKESPLITTFRTARLQFEKQFCLPPSTTNRSPLSMEKTIKHLVVLMQEKHAHEHTLQRAVQCTSIPEVMADGLRDMLKGA
jgi:hypothetical protein